MGDAGTGTVREVILPVQSRSGRGFEYLRYALKAVPFSSRDSHLVKNELDILRKVRESPYIVRLYHDWTEPFNKNCPAQRKFFGDMHKVEEDAKGANHVREIHSVAFIVMELSGQRHSGRNVKSPTDYMKTNPKPNGVVDMFLCLAKGLRDMHNLDILHRDIKPDNCLVSCGANAYRRDTAILGDLGCATRISMCRDVFGDSRYRPSGLLHNSKESDVYALGKTFREILNRNLRVRGHAIDEVRRLIISMMATTRTMSYFMGVRCCGPRIEKVVKTLEDILHGRVPMHQPVRRLSDPGRRRFGFNGFQPARRRSDPWRRPPPLRRNPEWQRRFGF